MSSITQPELEADIIGKIIMDFAQTAPVTPLERHPTFLVPRYRFALGCFLGR